MTAESDPLMGMLGDPGRTAQLAAECPDLVGPLQLNGTVHRKPAIAGKLW